MESTFSFEVKEKGRVVLPAGLRGACGFEVGSRLVARALGPGQAIVETSDAVMERIWSGAPTESVDAVGALWEWRAQEAERMAQVEPAGDDDSAAKAAESMLRTLGLD
jgi:bifunctional DNA-binding transcriptional regulator/antitoxin component of YhaV-PrlF toxin-antitoxin module